MELNGILRKLLAAIAALTCALFLLTGCGHKDDLQGTVSGKDVKAGYTYVYLMPIYGQQCSGSGTTRTCVQVITSHIPITYSVPTCYRIHVEGETSGDTCVDESKWNAIALGDDYVGKDVDPKDNQSKVVHH